MKMDGNFVEDMEMEHEADHKYEQKHEYKHNMGDTEDRSKSHKIMTMEDVAEQLAGDFEDEISDCKKYYHMAKTAEKANDNEDCHYLMEMSKDEFTHAYFIYSFMVEHDMHIPEEQEKEFECLKNKMKEFFR